MSILFYKITEVSIKFYDRLPKHIIYSKFHIDFQNDNNSRWNVMHSFLEPVVKSFESTRDRIIIVR